MAYDFSKISILVVDDNKPMLDLIKSLLITFGVKTVYIANNGEDGFRQFCRHKPDLVIADWIMSPTDGVTFTQMIRTDLRSTNKYVPVILMTGYSERSRVEMARDIGVNEFLVKPFNARGLYRRIVQVIERPRQFIRSEKFFGPDRRRVRKEEYVGPQRRNEEKKLYKKSKKPDKFKLYDN